MTSWRCSCLSQKKAIITYPLSILFCVTHSYPLIVHVMVKPSFVLMTTINPYPMGIIIVTIHDRWWYACSLNMLATLLCFMEISYIWLYLASCIALYVKVFTFLVSLEILSSDAIFTNNGNYCTTFWKYIIRITQSAFECSFVRTNIWIQLSSFGPTTY